jgi:hypothetical protein
LGSLPIIGTVDPDRLLTGFSDKTPATKEALGDMITTAGKCALKTSETEETLCRP